MAPDDRDKEEGEGHGDEHLVTDEEGEEASMSIEEIEEEPKDSIKVRRCASCRRMVFGHKGAVGKGKCELKKVENDEELKKDDKTKNEMRKKKRDIINKAKEKDEEKKLQEERDKALENLEAAKTKRKEAEKKAAEERKIKLRKEKEDIEKEIKEAEK